MNYELARQLQDAGFPQQLKNGSWVLGSDGVRICLTDIIRVADRPYLRLLVPKEMSARTFAVDTVPNSILAVQDITLESLQVYAVKAPTLSELIEACRVMTGGYMALEGHSNDCRAGTLKPGGREMFVSGATPEEAVAKLWLALNEKE